MATPATLLADPGTLEPANPAGPAKRLDRDVLLRRLLGASDSFAVVLALMLMTMIQGNLGAAPRRVVWGLVVVPLTILLFKLYGLYDRDVKRISHSSVDDLPWLVHAVAAITLLLWLYSRSTAMGKLNFEEVLVFAVAAAGLATIGRFSVRQSAVRLIGPERALLIGGGSMASALIRKLGAHPEYRVQVIGSLGHEGVADADLLGLPSLGGLSELEHVVSVSGARRIVLATTALEGRELEALLRRCRALKLKVSIVPTLSDVLGPGFETDDVEGVAVLGVNPPWLPRSSRAIKRAMDLAIAGGLLTICAPILLVLAVAIKLDSRGPVIFAQERVGRNGRRFYLLKLRTMRAGAETERANLLTLSSDPNWLKLDHDPRITRVGRWLRRLSLDELPQLWNVVRGEMSMVGPRPLVPYEDDRVAGWARGRVELTPGITGYWQVLGRTRIPFEEMVKLDYLYVMNWSLWEDVRLMLRTLPVVLSGRGAN